MCWRGRKSTQDYYLSQLDDFICTLLVDHIAWQISSAINAKLLLLLHEQFYCLICGANACEREAFSSAFKNNAPESVVLLVNRSFALAVITVSWLGLDVGLLV